MSIADQSPQQTSPQPAHVHVLLLDTLLIHEVLISLGVADLSVTPRDLATTALCKSYCSGDRQTDRRSSTTSGH